MARPYQILLPLLSLFICRVDLTDLFPLQFTGEVLQILDGDTVLVQSGNQKWKIRFSKIDAPEMGQPFALGQGRAGEFSKKCLEEILKKRHHQISIEGMDLYGRLLGNVGSSNQLMVERGCAGLYPHARFKNRNEKWMYIRLEQKARSARRGIWGRGGIMLPKVWRKLKQARKQNADR